MTYYRLHGSPRMHYSAYTEQYLASLASRIQTDLLEHRTAWCIFDNTTLGAATTNALDLIARLAAESPEQTS